MGKHKSRPGLLRYLEKRLGSFTGSGPEYQFWCPFCIDRVGDESSKRKLRFNDAKCGWIDKHFAAGEIPNKAMKKDG